MSLNIKNKKIAIIGAGISGLVLANNLSKLASVTVFDKSRGIGGRMTTRRSGNYHFDHGAQFFTARSEDFKEFCKDAESSGVIQDWQPRYAEITGFDVISKGNLNEEEAHFVAKPQMNSLCKYLAKDLNVVLNKRIESVSQRAQKWFLKASDEEFGAFDYLILAIPSHQCLELVPNNFKYFDDVASVKMLGCFSLMLGIKEKLSLGFDVARVKESIISLISVNNSKPERPEDFSLLIHSTNDWAESYLEENQDWVKEQMMSHLSKIIDLKLDNIEYDILHRWRYANSNYRQGKKSLWDSKIKLGVCGDWLISGSVENAFLSGTNLYQKIILD